MDFRAAIRAGLVLAMFGVAGPSPAQVPPGADEIAAYQGLHRAAHAGDVGEIRRLLASGAAPDARDGRQRTPLHVACHARQREAMRALAAGKADPKAVDAQNYDCITIAAVADDVPTLEAAIAIGGDPRQITSPYQGTALIAAAHLGHDGVVKTLIGARAPLDHVNNLHWTALIEAVILGNGGPRHVETVRLLVEAGARRDLADREGRTPLDHARSRGYAAMVALLTK
ncbi:MAG: ankyrin repeat domain-containing protein [Beijerinckiaceae bacterium]|nr:ankyrin repeat domain-containing protein [Beijerinckiaceae bacterium]MCZ8300129.1 ankyrin repeat domain-containing protein [Beijerinckiaceae bacterium]